MDNLKDILSEVAVTEVLTRAQRIKKARALKKAQPKIKRAKERAKRKPITKDKVEKKARRMAVDALKSRINKAGQDGGDKSFSQREREEKYIKKNKGKIEKLAKKFKKQAKTDLKADRERRKNEGKDKD